MNKNLKKILIVLLFVFTFGLTGCTSNDTTVYCEESDVESIKTHLKDNMNNGTAKYESYATPDYAALEASGVLSTMTSDGVTYTTELTWNDLDEKYKDLYVDYVYNKYHPKACLAFEDHIDEFSGGTISAKDFTYAFKYAGLFGMLAWPFAWLFVKGASLFGGVSGVTIIVSMFLVTFLVKGIILLLTFKSSKQQQVIQSLQPQLNAINEKYAGRNDDYSKQAKAQEMMNLYNKNNVNPMSSLLTPFITLPILIAVYDAIRYTTVIFEQTVAGVSLGANLGQSILSGNWIAILIFVFMACAQFTTMKLPMWLSKKNLKVYQREKANNSQMNGMSYFFLIMIVVLALSLPIAMSIYWIASSIFAIFQTLLLNGKKGKKKHA